MKAKVIFESIARWLGANCCRGSHRGKGGLWLLVVLSLFAVGCFSSRRLEPVSGESLAQASAGGLRLTADAEAWTGATWTEQHSVPVWVEIENRRDVAVRVSDTDWAMLGEGGLALAAFTSDPDFFFAPPPPVGGDVLPGSSGYASRRWLAPAGYRSGRSGQSRSTTRAAYPARTGFRWGAGQWGIWSRQSRSSVLTGRPIRTWDMIRLALGEGELQPGERMAGFVYFPRRVLTARRLALTWLVHDVEGQPLGVLDVDFRVRRGSDGDASSPSEPTTTTIGPPSSEQGGEAPVSPR